MKFITLKRIGELAGVSVPTLTRMAKNGVIPGATVVCRRVRYNEAVVLDWLARGGVLAGADQPAAPHTQA